jgi:hypothetical protein
MQPAELISSLMPPPPSLPSLRSASAMAAITAALSVMSTWLVCTSAPPAVSSLAS